ncbi:MAG: universal stress protein [Nitrospira sp.]|jgi:nucleotide-binding universal stress UspA family protein|nr:MAG: universal stress protein [Nitrospira sp.]
MFIKILAAIDGKDTSMKALMEAKRMAVSNQSTLRIVHVATEDTDPKDSLRLLARAKSAVGDGVTIDTRVLHTEAVYGVTGIVDALANGAREWGADLVVVGSSHRRGLERWVIGSVAEQLIAKVDASVLLVRPQ